MERADPHRLVRAYGQQLRPRQRARAEVVEVEVAVGELEELRAELVLVAVGVLLDEAVRLERAQKAVHGALREAEPVRELADAEPARAGRRGPSECELRDRPTGSRLALSFVECVFDNVE